VIGKIAIPDRAVMLAVASAREANPLLLQSSAYRDSLCADAYRLLLSLL